MFVNTQAKGTNMAFPDTCKTPVPPAGPVPIPYPNTSEQMTASPPVTFVLVEAAPAHNLKTKCNVSNGDNAGVAGGVVSSKFMGASQVLMGSMVLMIDGQPAIMAFKNTGQNLDPLNGSGIVAVPSQTTLMVMS